MNSSPDIIALGLDPGYVNFGWAVSRINFGSDNLSVKCAILGYGKIHSPITNLTKNVDTQVSDLMQELLSIMTQYQVTFVSAERYQARGFKGVSIEYVNVMIGLLITMLHHRNTPHSLILPSTWKNAAKKESLNLKALYKTHKAFLSPHEIDAIFISIYGAYIKYSNLFPLSGISSNTKQMITSCPTTVSHMKEHGKLLFV